METEEAVGNIGYSSRHLEWKMFGRIDEHAGGFPVPTVGEHTPDGWTRRLLVRRQITAAGAEPQLAYYLSCAPATTPDEQLIRVAGARWAIEECFQTAKTEVGLDHYQVRHYDAWYRHITLALLAHAYLAVTAAIAHKT